MDDTSVLSVAHEINTSANELTNDLAEINHSTFQWKMNFNLDPSKQTQEVMFSQKSKKITFSITFTFHNPSAFYFVFNLIHFSIKKGISIVTKLIILGILSSIFLI